MNLTPEQLTKLVFNGITLAQTRDDDGGRLYNLLASHKLAIAEAVVELYETRHGETEGDEMVRVLSRAHDRGNPPDKKKRK